ncbi:MAG: C4-dicarboxylate ABC transporter substrate-binding protein, partial [Deltaproteobacteria bacterium]|nr:C4-dicarboxylate ABC transporter substrate-binding protein [Deltaproteobacteria bacterium]
QIQAAKDSGVTFYRLSEEEKAELINKAKSMYDKWGEKIGAGYFQKVQSMLEN